MPAQIVGTPPSQCIPILNLLVRTLLWRSCLSKEARAHRPPYTATAEGESSWERGGSGGGEGEGVRGSLGVCSYIGALAVFEGGLQEESGCNLIFSVLHFCQSCGTPQPRGNLQVGWQLSFSRLCVFVERGRV